MQETIRTLMMGKGDALRIEHDYSQFVATQIAHFLKNSPNQPDIIGWHGQTIIHRPQEGITWQMGNPALLVDALHIPVIHDFRRRDMAAGGQGAPLVPLYHAALAHSLPKPLAIVNIGGVANVTYLGEHDFISAWDTGTGNALLNDWIVQHTGQQYDPEGRYAAAGTPDAARLSHAMQHPYFAAPPPKSLDRNAFTLAIAQGLSLEDGAATLTAFTVETIASAARHFPDTAKQWVVCGGGAHNTTMMQMLCARLNHPALRATDLGWRTDALEAEAFAYLAVRSLRGLPLSLPTTTGTRYAVTGGVLCQ
jgi:anhydro-N-acetylmuramic acid kinase